ncbi:MAG TPA: pyridoxamine 5'-phosphate oxidase family protein [Chitinophagales bacterium]|nr:pyridoxamine 5'-phosphate oxidase family protein [Chitinophagales bacterium]
MGKFFTEINEHHQAFIEKQHLFFVSTAPLSAEGHINLSPKGLDSFRVLGPNEVGYMDLVSKGNETAAHALENGRITFMFCSFDAVPNILRLYGKAWAVLRDDPEWEALSSQFTIYPSTRQIIKATIFKIQTSCGFGVPQYEYSGERNLHFEWAEKKGTDGLQNYVMENNLISIDGLPTKFAGRVNPF